MGHIRVRKETGLLYFDFQYLGIRCREQTKLTDTPANRKKMVARMVHIETEIENGTFIYEKYFSNGSAIKKIKQTLADQKSLYSGLPTFKQFANEWFSQKDVEWRISTAEGYRSYLDNRLIPEFGEIEVSRITKSHILDYRSSLAKASNGKLKAKTVNKVMKFLKMVLDEAATRHDFTSPYQGIKALKEEKVHIEPFSLQEVKILLDSVREDWKAYFIVRFFTGARTGEVDGLKWEYVDFENRQILIRETFSKGRWETTKNDSSQREIDMSQLVYDTLFDLKHKQNGQFELVFVSPKGEPINNSNFLNRVWKPLLGLCGLKYRRPYQTRHTAATLWLAAGENPSWIAQQMGHANTEMLFKVYTRYVPNMTRQDGSAMESLIVTNFKAHENISIQVNNGSLSQQIPNEGPNLDKSTDDDDIFWDQLMNLSQKEQPSSQGVKS